MSTAKFAVSLMCMDFLDVRNQLEVLNRRADLYHVDIMDGHYCPNITLSPDMVKAFHRVATLPMDCHLMTTNPNDWIEPLAESGADIISPHVETMNVNAFRTLNRIEALGMKCGAVLNPATPLDAIQHYVDRLDILTIMTVDVGFAGQAFISQMCRKIEEAAEWKVKKGLQYEIQIDGGCNKKTYQALTNAGAEIFILGSSGLFNLDEDLDTAYDKMLADYQAETHR